MSIFISTLICVLLSAFVAFLILASKMSKTAERMRQMGLPDESINAFYKKMGLSSLLVVLWNGLLFGVPIGLLVGIFL
jgi:hypothetical protein